MSRRSPALVRSTRCHMCASLASNAPVLSPEKLYTDQRATVLIDVESDEFGIARGTKQGDPLSRLRCNLGFQSAMEKDV